MIVAVCLTKVRLLLSRTTDPGGENTAFVVTHHRSWQTKYGFCLSRTGHQSMHLPSSMHLWDGDRCRYPLYPVPLLESWENQVNHSGIHCILYHWSDWSSRGEIRSMRNLGDGDELLALWRSLGNPGSGATRRFWGCLPLKQCD